ncbi:MAG: ABC transporter ATP-binding protein [Deltaproteobacteria bacterium]|nr:ABC transporter ATP-binding protein [Deltaproteobacteria bacterium]
MGESLLDVRMLNKAFGSIVTARDLNFSLCRGVITSIIGPNGAGKSTLINVLTGLLGADSGEIWFQGREVTREPIHRRVKLGLGRSFQVVNVFGNLTLFENLAIPVLALNRRAKGMIRSIARLKEVREDVEMVLTQVGLIDEAYMVARSLSHGDQRLLEVAIALAAKPRLLFLDEPTAGMNPVERSRILKTIRELSQTGEVTFTIVEHDMDIVFSLSDRVIALHKGKIIGDGSPDQIKMNPQVREVYLGEEVA